MTAPAVDRQFLAFLAAGAVNTLFGYCAFGGLVLLGVLPHVAVVASTIAGVLFNYFTTSVVFRAHRHARDLGRLPRFLAVYGVMLTLNILLLDLVMRAGLGPLLAQAVILPVFTLTFLAMRRFVFAASPEQPS